MYLRDLDNTQGVHQTNLRVRKCRQTMMRSPPRVIEPEKGATRSTDMAYALSCLASLVARKNKKLTTTMASIKTRFTLQLGASSERLYWDPGLMSYLSPVSASHSTAAFSRLTFYSSRWYCAILRPRQSCCCLRCQLHCDHSFGRYAELCDRRNRSPNW